MPDNDNGNNRDAIYSNTTLHGCLLFPDHRFLPVYSQKADRGYHLRPFEMVQDNFHLSENTSRH